MAAVTLRMPEDLKTRLDHLSARTGRSKNSYMLEAIQEHIGNLEVLHLAEKRLLKYRSGRSKPIPQEEMERRYGLAD